MNRDKAESTGLLAGLILVCLTVLSVAMFSASAVVTMIGAAYAVTERKEP